MRNDAWWPGWVVTYGGDVPAHATVDYAAKKAVAALREAHPDAELVLLDQVPWLLVPDGPDTVTAYPADGGDSVFLFEVSGSWFVGGRSKGGRRPYLAKLRRAVARFRSGQG